MLIHSSCSAGVRHISANDCMMVMAVSLGLGKQAGALAFDLGPGSSSTQPLPVVVHSECKVLSGGIYFWYEI